MLDVLLVERGRALAVSTAVLEPALGDLQVAAAQEKAALEAVRLPLDDALVALDG